MNRIERMLQELCPEGVEYRRIGDIFVRLKGTPITATKMKEINNPNGEIKIFAGGKTVINANEDDIENANIIRVPSVIVQSRGVIDVIYYDQPFTFKNEMWAYTINSPITVKYLYYVLKNSIQIFRDKASIMGALPQISLQATEKFEIPIPPLHIQEEIIRILDHFTELTASLQAELQAELQARQEQYEYYRNKLLTFDAGSVTWMKMSEICNLQRGKVYSKEYLRDNQGIYPVYSSQTINNGELGRISTYDFDGTYLTWTTDGAYAGTIFKRKGKFSITNVCGIISMKSDLVTMDFLYYWLSLKAKEYVYSGMGNPKLMSNQVEKILVPIPALSEQQRIVSILDKFETLVNDLSQGLPAEIAAVQEQYEYYRNKLLTFNRIKLI